MATNKNKLGRQYGWPGWVVPCDMLAAELDARKDELRYEDRHPSDEDPDNGWRTLISARASKACGASEVAIFRRLYDVMHGRAKVIGADTAEALLMAVGADMDRDTLVPTLPGCRSAAVEMAECHREFHDKAMTDEEVGDLARSLLNFCVGFLYGEDWLADQEADAARQEFEVIVEGQADTQLAIPELAAA